MVPQPFPRERPDRAQADLERRIADGRFRVVIPREELDPRVEGLHAVIAGRGDVLARVGVEAIAPRLNRPVFGFAGPAVRGEVPLVRSSLTTVERSTATDRFRKLSVRDRLRLGAEIVEQVPVKAASTPKAHISFDYCVVTISRPWLMSAFLTNRYWGIPGLAAGGFTGAQDGLWAVPAAVVVIRNLVVTADWDAADVARSQEAMSFGPFKIDSGIVDNSLRSPGLQTIGWLSTSSPGYHRNERRRRPARHAARGIHRRGDLRIHRHHLAGKPATAAEHDDHPGVRRVRSEADCASRSELSVVRRPAGRREPRRHGTGLTDRRADVARGP